MSNDKLSGFLRIARTLGDGLTISEGDACKPYQRSCNGVSRRIPAVVQPVSERQIVALVKAANEFQIPLYPISTGHNWGYATANPVQDDCVVVDLSAMTGIRDFDPELGVVTLEPGVTQGQLATFLETHGQGGGAQYMVPVSGAGPTCSLVGNALERGFGITPYGDHFAAVTGVRAVLANGDIYRPALSGLGCETIDRLHKWGLGPYLDGLFSQGAFGIVTEMHIVLARRPEVVETFLIEIDKDENLEAAVKATREILQVSQGAISSINLMNRLRVISMTEPYPADRVEQGQVIPKAIVEEMGRKNLIPPWTGLGAVYGDAKLVKALRGLVRRKLGPCSRRIVFLSGPKVEIIAKAAPFIPGKLGAKLQDRLVMMRELLDILGGRPSETALRLCYWRSGKRPPADLPMDPARDGCGLHWYSPLVPAKPQVVRDYVEMVEKVCTQHGIEPLITLTSLSERLFDSTVPILFDLEHEQQTGQACLEALTAAGKRQGLLPYRLGVQSMADYTRSWGLVGAIKNALDPNDILAPGRYAPPTD